VRKVLFYAAPLAALAMAWSGSVRAQEPFKDLDKDHWAYQAVVDLQQKGILIGYPGDYFKGKRTLTRYEFAIAIRRLLDHLPPGTPGPQGDAGAPGPPGPSGSAGPDYGPQIDEIKRLVDEFKNELAAQGVRIGDIEKRLDALTKDVDAIKNRLDRMVHFTGDVFFGFRGNESGSEFRDYGGALQGHNSNLFTNVDALHDFHLGVNANLSGDVKFKGDIVISNYLSYQGNSLAANNGQMAINTNAGLPENVGLYEADLSVPLKSMKSTLDVGRIKEQLTPLTMWRPDYDPYFDLPWYDDGAYVMDGLRISSKFGSATTQVWAGSFASVVTDQVGFSTAPLLGGVSNGVRASETAGLHVAVPVGHMGEVGVSLMDFSANRSDISVNSEVTQLVVYGANFKLKPIGRFTVEGEAAKSVEQQTITSGAPGVPNDANNAYMAQVGWGSGGLGINAGYLYVDPDFAAPGYWAKLGNFYNPTNIGDVFARASYSKNKLSATIQGDMIEGVRNRYSDLEDPTLPGISDRIYRYKGGIGYKFNKTWNLSVDYEAVQIDLSNKATGDGFLVTKPLEQFLTFGAGVNLSGNTTLKVAYQIISASDQNGFSLLVPTGAPTSNANVFTTQLAVHF